MFSKHSLYRHAAHDLLRGFFQVLGVMIVLCSICAGICYAFWHMHEKQVNKQILLEKVE